jgi:hypothetical protein
VVKRFPEVSEAATGNPAFDREGQCAQSHRRRNNTSVIRALQSSPLS